MLSKLGQDMLDRSRISEHEWLLYLGCCELISKVFKTDNESQHLNRDTVPLPDK